MDEDQKKLKALQTEALRSITSKKRNNFVPSTRNTGSSLA
jgi:hypothetical protein